MLSNVVLTLGLLRLAQAATVVYAVPAAAPTNATALDAAPVGVSFEFFMWPSYMTNVTATNQCLANLEALSGTWPPIRIGGTTQDRGDYNPALSAYISYAGSGTTVPATLTYGPKFIDLAAAYKGRVTMGLDRGHGNITNTILAAKYCKSTMTNLLAIEAGNEPEYWSSSGNPIVAQEGGTWNAAIDAQSQDDWAIRIGQAISTTSIMEEGNSLEGPPTWGATELIATENTTAKSYVKSFSQHAYPGGSTTTLMEHKQTVSQMAGFKGDITSATAIGKEYVYGETNSVSGGGAATVSPTYSAAMWVLDYSLYSTFFGVKRLYFHHGTLGACQYCWWGRYSMGAPYYGAYAAAAALAGGSKIAMLDAGTTNYATYVIYASTGKPLRAVLINTDYYSGSGTRGSESFTLTGFTTTTVKAKRLTAASSEARVDQGSPPTFGGQQFANGSCIIIGTEVYETTNVSSGAATFTVNASEALVVYF